VQGMIRHGTGRSRREVEGKTMENPFAKKYILNYRRKIELEDRLRESLQKSDFEAG
jgi:hypothetical protein